MSSTTSTKRISAPHAKHSICANTGVNERSYGAREKGGLQAGSARIERAELLFGTPPCVPLSVTPLNFLPVPFGLSLSLSLCPRSLAIGGVHLVALIWAPQLLLVQLSPADQWVR